MWSFVFFIPSTTENDLRLRRIFYPRFYPLHLFSYLNYWERASIVPFECSVLNKGSTGTIFITSLVWRGPWLGIESGTTRIRSQHYTNRLSRRRLSFITFLNRVVYARQWAKYHSYQMTNFGVQVKTTLLWRFTVEELRKYVTKKGANSYKNILTGELAIKT